MEYALNEKKSSRRENAENLRSILGEAMNRDRTEQDLFQSALGCTLASPFADMLDVKKQWRKLGGRGGLSPGAKLRTWGSRPGTGPPNRAGTGPAAAGRGIPGGGEHPPEHPVRPQSHCVCAHRGQGKSA